jgi:Metalloenzyme superfamily
VNPSRGLVLVAAALTTTCVPAKELPSPAARSVSPAETATESPIQGIRASVAESDEPTPVILVVLDGVRWQEIFEGVDPALARTGSSGRAGAVVDARRLMPALYAALDARGAALGAPGHGSIAASGPNFVSLPGYTEIFGGRPPERCQDNACAGASGPTLVDAMRDRASSDSDVAVIASWGPIGRAATRSPAHIVLSAGREERAGTDVLTSDDGMRDVLERGARANPWPGHDTFRPDRYTSELALRYLEAKRPAFLFVGLGEPDEYAHAGDYPGYLSALRAADAFFGGLFATLDRMGERGRRSMVLVTADHGRARDYRDHGGGLPESARVWLLAMGGPIHARGFVQTLSPRHLADIAPTIREIVGLPSDDSVRAGMPMIELLGSPESSATVEADRTE